MYRNLLCIEIGVNLYFDTFGASVSKAVDSDPHQTPRRERLPTVLSLFHRECMSRIDDQALSLHFEVALSGIARSLLTDLAHADRFRRSAAVSTLAHYLASRMRCFEITMEEEVAVKPLPLFRDA